MLTTQYKSVASEPKEEFRVTDADYFFFSTSPEPLLSQFHPVQPTAPTNTECQLCQQELLHLCQEDQGLQGQNCQESTRSEELRVMIEQHFQRIEEGTQNEDNISDQDDQGSQDDQAKEPMNSMICDWLDVSSSIESMPGGAALRPD